MLDITDKGTQPTVEELADYVGNPLFGELCRIMEKEFQALVKIEYSGDKLLLGWNIKFKKGGRTLCTAYPRIGHFPLLLVIGRKEKERTEELLPELSEEFRSVYESTREGMGQRWLIFDFAQHNDAFDDVIRIVHIRRQG